MRVLTALVVVAACAETRYQPIEASQHARRDPMKQPTTLADARCTTPEVKGRTVPAGDLDGDGVGDLFVERGGTYGAAERIDAISSLTGSTIRTVWRFGDESREEFAWDAGDDVDGDGVSDLLLGF